MIKVANRSEESWGPLAKCDDKTFNKLINTLDAKNKIKDHLKKQKKLKTYSVSFEKHLYTKSFELQADDTYNLSSVAREFFKNNKDSIEFIEKQTGKWADSYNGYDTFRFVKIR